MAQGRRCACRRFAIAVLRVDWSRPPRSAAPHGRRLQTAGTAQRRWGRPVVVLVSPFGIGNTRPRAATALPRCGRAARVLVHPNKTAAPAWTGAAVRSLASSTGAGLGSRQPTCPGSWARRPLRSWCSCCPRRRGPRTGWCRCDRCPCPNARRAGSPCRR